MHLILCGLMVYPRGFLLLPRGGSGGYAVGVVWHVWSFLALGVVDVRGHEIDIAVLIRYASRAREEESSQMFGREYGAVTQV